MKKIQLFHLENCPFCRSAIKDMEKLFKKRPELREVPLELIEEREQAELAETYDYYYVPTFYVDGVKVHEGIVSARKIAKIFKDAHQG